MKTTCLILSLLSATQYVIAHGYVKTVTLAGKSFTANYPFGSEGPSGIRKVSDVTPIKGAKNPDILCGINATKPASLVLATNPGDPVTFDWRGADDSFWPHDMGPMLTYMASCGNTTCDQFDASNAKWFKIAQIGQKEGSGDWVQKDLMTGAVVNANIPNNVAPGQYLVRHEIIALHLADQMGGAEFYSSCTQVNIGGSGNGVPSPNELVSIPGVYDDSDPGIYTPEVFNPGFKYDFPGPPISKLAGTNSGAGSSGISSSVPASTTKSTPTPTPTPTTSRNGSSSSSSSGSCRLVRHAKSSNQPRHFARVMRTLGVGSNRH